MDNRIDWQFLTTDTRARIYLLWAILLFLGFIATHYYQVKLINGVWAVLSLIGLGYMYKTMPIRVKQMKRIFYIWAATIVFGMFVSGAVFYFNSPLAGSLIARLGAFWLIVMAVGYALNGLVDRPAGWYWFAFVINVIFGTLCFVSDAFVASQYIVAAIVSGWSMLNLWLFRTH